jgi:fumarate reductase subunit C
MSNRSSYTIYHPQWLRRRVSTFWWMQRWSYFVFILRELSSIFVAWFVVYLLFLVRAVSEGAASYQQFLDWSRSPMVLVLNLVSLFFIVFHAITWFNLAPAAMVAHVRGKRVPGFWIAASNYAGWIVASAVVIWVLFED